MTIQFDDILTALCTHVASSHSNDFQNVYTLEGPVEAKLAHDVLVAYGFDAKVYHTAGKPSKLYITTPEIPADKLQTSMASALAYAQTLRKIKTSLDDLCASDIAGIKNNGFTIAFVNVQPSGKQILIQISQSGADAQTISKPADMAPIPASSQPPAAAAKVASSQARVSKKVKKPKEDEFDSGPSLSRRLYPTKIVEGGIKKQTMRKKIMLRLFGNFATSGYAALMWLILMGVLFSCFVFAKSFLCYDFVAKKSTKWYCQDQTQMSAEDARKLEQQERQKKLGLAPVEQ